MHNQYILFIKGISSTGNMKVKTSIYIHRCGGFGVPNHPSLQLNCKGHSTIWLSQRHTKALLTAAILLMSDHGI